MKDPASYADEAGANVPRWPTAEEDFAEFERETVQTSSSLEYRTTDTDELAPYPNMTAEDLYEFEAWAAEIEGQTAKPIVLMAVILVALGSIGCVANMVFF